MWREPGLEHIASTTRVVHIITRELNSFDAGLHHTLVNGNPILIDVAGRPPMCLPCRQIAHISRLCTTPWCHACCWFGHAPADCSQSYADRTRQPETTQSLEEYVDSDEMAAGALPLAPALACPPDLAREKGTRSRTVSRGPGIRTVPKANCSIGTFITASPSGKELFPTPLGLLRQSRLVG
ncbi:hypothetical protein HPB48_017684 [Haemaphysalis longicornis]|uniref:Uncharacterized protein n=1 Tax=Haemaphysalis longicornis TaxID=44386 RepID=A0A9J6FCE9_HAELO|nr:hypothetical protein HPB48_017684 [Haemaphysalis longicornis]